MQVNPLTREVLVKIVYYGPGLGGKTTSLSCIHQAAPPETRGQIVSLATPVDRTLYFDFLPVRMAPVSQHHVRLQLFTVPGQVYFNATRKLVLTGADGVVFVADSQRGRHDANVESLENLSVNLEEQGRALADVPWVLQLNKRDLDDVMSVEELEGLLNPTGVASFPTCATTGEGVLTALDTLVHEVLEDLDARGQLGKGKEAASDLVLSRAEQSFEERVGRLSEAKFAAGVGAVSAAASAASAVPAVPPAPRPPSSAPQVSDAGDEMMNAEAAVEAELGRASEELWKSAVKRAEAETRSASVPPRTEPSAAAALARELANLSFASLFPRHTDAALSLEGDLATGALRSAVERADALADVLLRETARRAGLSSATSPVSVVLLLGIDGATWLSFRRLVERVREGGPVADRDALAAYALVIDLRLRADRIL